MRRRGIVNIEPEESTDRWLVSYADFITLLFAFFVVMYSISNVNLGKYRVLSESVSTAFSAQSNSPFPVGANLGISVQRAPVALGLIGQTGQVSMKETAAQIDKRMKPWIKKGMIAVKGNEKWLEIEIKSSLLFNSGNAILTDESTALLTELAGNLRDAKNPLYVSGYTDDVPIGTRVFPTNWELSAARAASVVRLFAETGIDPSRMGAIGYAEYRPIAANDTEENRQKNRRVVIRMMAGEDAYADSSPFAEAESRADATAGSAQPVDVIDSLLPGEPVRSIFGVEQ